MDTVVASQACSQTSCCPHSQANTKELKIVMCFENGSLYVVEGGPGNETRVCGRAIKVKQINLATLNLLSG